AAPVTLRARTVISGAPERRRTLTDSDGFAAAPGAGTGTQLPTRLTGELSFAVWPVCDVNVVSMVAPVHSGLPTVNRPFGPPLIVSSNDVSGAPGRRRTLTDSDGFAAAPGAGTGTQLPTRLTGELSFAVWPVCDVNVVSMVAPVHSGLPTVNRPFGPPLIVSSNDVTGAAGR